MATWAEARRILPRGNSTEPGRYRVDRLPYQREPMESFTDPTASETVLEWARQLGKTTLLENLLGYCIDADPCNCFVVYPTTAKARDFSQKKLAPMIRATPELRQKIKSARTRDSGNTILSKLFPGGSISMAGANSPAALRQLSCKVVVQDEVDAFRENAEGDPGLQADAVATNFHDATFAKASSPTKKPIDDGRGGKTGSRIQILFDESDQRYWNVPCPRCNHWQVLRWSQVKWTWTREDGTVYSDPRDACYVCEACNSELSDFERVRMVMQGRWVPKNPGALRRGYHLSGLYRIMGKKRAYKSFLHEFVAGYLKALKEGTLEVWTNTFLAECWEDLHAKLDVNPIWARREKYGPTLPLGALVLIGTVDVQGDRLEYLIKGWGLFQETWGIERDSLMGDPHQKEVWQLLAQRMARTFDHPTLGKMQVPIWMIDSGGQSNDQGFADPVYRFVRPRQPFEIGPGVYASKGSSKVDAPLVSNRRPKKGICLKMIGTSTAKLTVHARLRLSQPGARFCHYPVGHGFDEEYFEQLGAEVPSQIKRRGFTFTEWVKVRSRNEGLDLEAMQLAAYEVLNPDINAIALRAGQKVPEVNPQSRRVRIGRPQFWGRRPRFNKNKP